MDLFTEKFGFEREDLGGVTETLSDALNLKPEHRFIDGYGGDISSF